MRGLRRRLLGWLHQRPEAQAWSLLGPGVFWLLAFFLIPVLIILGASLMHRGVYGGVEPGLTLEPYRRFFSCLVYLPRDRYSTSTRMALPRPPHPTTTWSYVIAR